MNKRISPTGNEKIVFKGTIFAVVQYEVNEDGIIKTFEAARRSPGTRLIIVDRKEKKILLSDEGRHELKERDFRLPGGKVFNGIDEYMEFKFKGGDIKQKAQEAATDEARQEAGIEAKSIQHIWTSGSGGSTVEWDLYYFLIEDFIDHNDQILGAGEDIKLKWFKYNEAKQLCLDGKIQEDRSVGVLLKFLLAQ